MRKLIVLGLVLLALWAMGRLPFHAADVAELLPVRTVLVDREGNKVSVDAGIGVRGVGDTLSEALASLRERASGRIFFGTAEQVILTDRAVDLLPEALDEPSFRPAAGVYLTTERDLDPDAAADYLSTHSSNLTLIRLKALREQGEEVTLPVLRRVGGGFCVSPE